MDPFSYVQTPLRMLTTAYSLRSDLRSDNMSVSYSMNHYIQISDGKGRVIGSLYVDYEGEVSQVNHANALDEPELFVKVHSMLERMRRYVLTHGWKAFRKSVARA